MAEQEIVGGALGPEAKFALKRDGLKVIATVALDTKGVDASVSVGVEGDYFVDQLKELIPGKIDDAIFDMLKVALKA